jgi:ATP-binding cassette subfamily B protein
MRLLGLAWRYRLGSLKVLFSQVAALWLSLLSVWLVGVGVDWLRYRVDGSLPGGWVGGKVLGWLPSDTVIGVFWVSGAVLVVSVLRWWVGYLSGVWTGELLQGQVVAELRERCYEKLQRMPFGFEGTTTTASLMNRVGGDVQSVRLFIDGVLLQVVIMVISVAMYLGYMLMVHVRLTWACLSVTPVLWVLAWMFSRAVRPEYRKASSMVDRMTQHVAEVLRAMTVVRGFSREGAEVSGYEVMNNALREQQFRIFGKVTVFVPLTIFFSQASQIILLGYGGVLAVRGEIGVGTGLLGFAFILQQFTGQVAGIGNIANSMQQCLQAAERVFEILDAESDVPVVALPEALKVGDVEFRGVGVDRGGSVVLRGVSFRVKRGECVGIVGPTGAGKSTLLSLIPRFLDVSEGEVRFGGTDVRSLDPRALRARAGVMFQESFLFSTTVAANIAYGVPDVGIESIREAAQIAHADGFISELPLGYETVLGEMGVGLSGGQRQRIALARALVMDPDILILDDPTAAVDAETEEAVVRAVVSAMRGRTTFVVAHRPSMLRHADRIFVLEDGRVVDDGTFDVLMTKPGYFRDAMLLQRGEVGA